MSTYTEPLAQIDLHARNVDQAHRDIIATCIDLLPHGVTRAELSVTWEQLEDEYAGSDDMSAAGDYSGALAWIAEDAERAVNDYTPYIAGTVTESGTWYIAEPAWWEQVDA